MFSADVESLIIKM